MWHEYSLKSLTLQNLCCEKNISLSVAESCSGGLLSALLTSNDEASKFFLGSTICYHNQVKTKLLHVQPEIIEKYGAVSKQCCESMAKGCLSLFSSNMAIALTGVAGASSSPYKPTGLVYVSVLYKLSRCVTKKLVFDNQNRHSIQLNSALASIDLAIDVLTTTD